MINTSEADFINSQKDPFFIINKDIKFEFKNNKAQQFFDSFDVNNNSFEEFLEKLEDDHSNSLKDYLVNCFDNLDSFKYNFDLKNHQNDSIILEAKGIKIEINSQRFVAIFFSTLKINEEHEKIIATQQDLVNKQSEEIFKLNYELTNYKNAINNASIVSITDTNGIIKFVNQNFIDACGYSEKELIGQNHNIVNSGFHEKDTWTNMWATITKGKVWRGELKNRNKNGNLYWVDSFIMPFYDNKSNIIEYLSIRNNITDRKNAEEKIRQTAVQLKAIYESTTDINIFLDLECNIVAFNKSAYQQIYMVFNRELVIGENYLNLVNESYIKDFMADFEIAKQGKTVEQERLVITDLYPASWYLRRLIPIRNEFDVIIGIALDSQNIDERKKAEALIIEEKEKALQVANLKSNILNNLSHEFRTPINAIFGFSELIRRTSEDEDLSEMIGFIQNSTKRLNYTLEAILLLSRLVSVDKYQFSNSKFNLQDLIRGIVDSFNDEIQTKNLEIKFNLPESDTFVFSDEELIRQIIIELISNAVKFTNKGEILISLSITNADFIFSVKDSGVGIDPKYNKEIFKEFRQGSEGLNRSFEGIGLGLTIAEKIAYLLKGEILFDSQVGVGTTFTIIFPITNNC